MHQKLHLKLMKGILNFGNAFWACKCPFNFSRVNEWGFSTFFSRNLCFFYDILVYSQNVEDHVKDLREVFNTLVQQKLYVKRTTCKFVSKDIKYLYHIVSSEGVQVNPRKVETMIKWPKPTNLKSLRGFLDLTNYYRRFIKGYKAIECPLTMLLKKRAFN